MRTIKGSSDNEAQVKITRGRKRRENRSRKQTGGRENRNRKYKKVSLVLFCYKGSALVQKNYTGRRVFQNKTGNIKTDTEVWKTGLWKRFRVIETKHQHLVFHGMGSLIALKDSGIFPEDGGEKIEPLWRRRIY